MLGLVLAGGGARGAYEAGVLEHVCGPLARRIGRPFRPQLVSGTSVGALTATWVAAADCGGANIAEIYRRLEPDHVYHMGPLDLLSIPQKLFGRRRISGDAGALFDPTPIRAMVRDTIPWGALYDRIDHREVHALIVAATDVSDGHCVQFVDGISVDHETPMSRMTSTRIGPDHLLGSAAIPFIFPPVAISGRHYLDGGLRQNTPLQPVIHLGATRVLVVSLQEPSVRPVGPERAYAPSPVGLMGKALDALTLDPIEEDIRRTTHMNDLLRWGARTYPGFLDNVAAQQHGYHLVNLVHVRPSVDLGKLASELFPRCAPHLPLATRKLLNTIAGAEDPGDADLMSYLLFHHSFTAELVDLGARDAAANEDALATLWDAAPASG